MSLYEAGLKKADRADAARKRAATSDLAKLGLDELWEKGELVQVLSH
jgi:hypothetical protein